MSDSTAPLADGTPDDEPTPDPERDTAPRKLEPALVLEPWCRRAWAIADLIELSTSPRTQAIAVALAFFGATLLCAT